MFACRDKTIVYMAMILELKKAAFWKMTREGILPCYTTVICILKRQHVEALGFITVID